jgi:hypothetical protein
MTTKELAHRILDLIDRPMPIAKLLDACLDVVSLCKAVLKDEAPATPITERERQEGRTHRNGQQE